MGMTKTSLWRLREALESCATCPGVIGTVLASPEGLVLSATGALEGDIPAAMAASIRNGTSSALAELTPSPAREVMVWQDDGLWFLTTVADNHVLLLGSTDTRHPGLLRATARRAAERLSLALRYL
mgnify:FL=1